MRASQREHAPRVIPLELVQVQKYGPQYRPDTSFCHGWRHGTAYNVIGKPGDLIENGRPNDVGRLFSYLQLASGIIEFASTSASIGSGELGDTSKPRSSARSGVISELLAPVSNIALHLTAFKDGRFAIASRCSRGSAASIRGVNCGDPNVAQTIARLSLPASSHSRSCIRICSGSSKSSSPQSTGLLGSLLSSLATAEHLVSHRKRNNRRGRRSPRAACHG